MNVLGVADLAHTIMDFLPDIRVLQISRELDGFTRTHPDYAIWKKCTRSTDICRYGTAKMLSAYTSSRVVELAIEGDHLEVVKRFALPVSDKMVHSAAKFGSLHVLEWLLRHYSAAKNDVLITACKFGSVGVVEFLIQQGVDRTGALEIASRRGHANVVEVLSRDVRADCRALDLACEKGHLDVVKLLVAACADIRVCEDWALRVACLHGRLDVAKFLVSAGANVQAVHNEPLAESVTHGHVALAKFLIAAGAVANGEMLESAVRRGDLKMVKCLSRVCAVMGADTKISL